MWLSNADTAHAAIVALLKKIYKYFEVPFLQLLLQVLKFTDERYIVHIRYAQPHLMKWEKDKIGLTKLI